jgi:ubiquitin conjugation factor E4 B
LSLRTAHCGYLHFRYAPQSLRSSSVDDVWTLPIVLLCSTNYISNRYLIAKFIEILFVVNPRVQPAYQKLNDMLLQNPLALDHLVPSLMKFYSGQSAIFIHVFNFK